VLSHPIGMKTNPSRRTGAATVAASAVIAGTIASSSGSAKVAPTPRKKRPSRKCLFGNDPGNDHGLVLIWNCGLLTIETISVEKR